MCPDYSAVNLQWGKSLFLLARNNNDIRVENSYVNGHTYLLGNISIIPTLYLPIVKINVLRYLRLAHTYTYYTY